VALANDTVGAMIASAYTDPETIIGGIFGTGCNAAYMESCSNISKIPNLPGDRKMAINCEYGAFDNSHRVLPRTRYDETIDAESPRPGEQTFEKMSAGLYLGEIFRLVLCHLHRQGLLFKDQDVSKLSKSYTVDTAFLSAIEDDASEKLSSTRSLFKETLNIYPAEPELEFTRRLAELIALRGARLCACGVAAICLKQGIKRGHVAADGSVANKHPKFKMRWAKALGEIMGWEECKKGGADSVNGPDAADGVGMEQEDPIIMTSAQDGSGVG
jgi:hexokinase